MCINIYIYIYLFGMSRNYGPYIDHGCNRVPVVTGFRLRKIPAGELWRLGRFGRFRRFRRFFCKCIIKQRVSRITQRDSGDFLANTL